MLIVPIYYVNFIFYFWFPPITANVHCAASSHTLWWAPKMEVSNSYKLIYLIDLCVDSSVAELELPAWKPRVVGQELEPNFQFFSGFFCFDEKTVFLFYCKDVDVQVANSVSLAVSQPHKPKLRPFQEPTDSPVGGSKLFHFVHSPSSGGGGSGSPLSVTDLFSRIRIKIEKCLQRVQENHKPRYLIFV